MGIKRFVIGWTLLWLIFSCYFVYESGFEYDVQTGVAFGLISYLLGMPASYFGGSLASYISIECGLHGSEQVVALVLCCYLFSLVFWTLFIKVIVQNR
ncbi:hypothetical protein GCM10007916_23340 [Psychromonas marina]|uniref:MFS transporter n=1 Tax=Psychromonas marina TaxID=88364 RepID=A0ABQ6E221_9GAMM|nr:hypothetical protein [Psychromonas marina]GLS91265.1 hypothetical protein GCM10007916_23340 [Psychromonas marina]